MKSPRSKTIALVLTLSLSFFTSLSFAAAFGIAEQSALGLGNAFAGGAASAEDASTIWYNPAGMTRIKGNQVVMGMHLIAPSFDFDDKGSTRASGAATGGDRSNDGGRFAVVPNFYYVHSLSDSLKLGLGANAPFGLATKYNDDWSGRYQAIESEIVTVNINPSIAWQATPELSLGFGISAQYIDATLNNRVDLGGPEGFAHLEADDWSAGFNLGALYQFSEHTRVGIAYRSEVRHKLKGDVDFDAPVPFPDSHVTAQPDLPASASVSIYHKYSDRVSVMADASWTGWSSIPVLTILYDAPPFTTGEILKLKDIIRLSVGATYNMDGPWTFRTGLAFDEGAARNAATRSPRFPDNDRYWLTFGASYQLADNLSIDTGYAHIFVPDTKINRSGAGLSAVVGEYESDADILSAQIRWDM
jgi:long-chain fatty acid transport protein